MWPPAGLWRLPFWADFAFGALRSLRLRAIDLRCFDLLVRTHELRRFEVTMRAFG